MQSAVCCLAYNKPLITDSHQASSLANETVTLTEKQSAGCSLNDSLPEAVFCVSQAHILTTQRNECYLPCAFCTTLKFQSSMYENVCSPVQALAEFRSIDFPLPLLFITEEYPAPMGEAGNPRFSQRSRKVFSTNADKKQFDPLPGTTS